MADKGFYAKLGLKDEEFRKKLQANKGHLNGFAQSIKSIGPMIAGAFSVGAITSFVKSAGEAYDLQMRAEKKVEQAVKQTGGAAGFTADELKKMASELQKVTRYGDENILNQVTAQLLSFPKITGAVFKDAQKAILDVATLLDGDIQSSAIAIGKALQDPVKGITAMRRMGIMFSEEQTKVISTLVEQNKLYEAQELILKEINLQYGGQAEAAAKTGLGAIEQLKNAWGDFKEAWFGANLADKAGKQNWLSQGLDYMTWRMNKFREEGGGFTEWWKRFLKLGEYSEESYNYAKNSEKNAEQLKKNADILQGVSGGFKSYGDMVNASAEAANKLSPAIEKTTEELEKEAKAAEDAAKAREEYLKKLQQARDENNAFADKSRMSSISGGADMNTGLFLRTGEMQFDLPTEDVKEFEIALRNTYDGMTTFSEGYAEFTEATIQMNEMVSESFKALSANMVSAMSNAIETWVEGGDGLNALFTGMLGAVVNFLKGLGEAMMAAGMAGLALKSLSMSPALSIAAGIALQLAAGVVQGFMNKGIGMQYGGVVPAGYPNDSYPAMLTSGETVVPPHKLGELGGQLSGEFRIKGSDLVYIVNRETNKLSRNR